MTRTHEQVLAQMRAAAQLVRFDATSTWAEVLFDGDGLARPTEPDQALLGALATEYAQVDRHVATLPDRLHLEWLERILGLPRLPVVPDAVIASATVDPALAPAVVKRGTVLRGGKDAFDQERRYQTDDALTAHGATVTAVRYQGPGGHDARTPGVIGEAPSFPLVPADGTDAPHTLRFYSPILAFDGGSATATISLAGATSATPLEHVIWRASRADGTVKDHGSGLVSGATVTITMHGGCGAPQGDPWIEAEVPASLPVPLELRFTGAAIAITGRSAYVPQAAFQNDGALDVSKECEPFGIAARQGDALYLRSDEAFSKPLNRVVVTIEKMPVYGTSLFQDYLLSELATDFSYVEYAERPYPVVTDLDYPTAIPPVTQDITTAAAQMISADAGVNAAGMHTAAAADSAVAMNAGTTSAAPTLVEWQRKTGGAWQALASAGSQLSNLDKSTSSPSSPWTFDPAVIGGQQGRYIRAFIKKGDFGWVAYQAALANFATEALKGNEPQMPVPPAARTVTRLTMSYTTSSVAVTRVEARNGWVHTTKPDSAYFWSPFEREVSDQGDTGMMAFGLDIPASASGSSVSVYISLDSAAPCGSDEDLGGRWQWWDGVAWQPLVVADATHVLRESGLLRFVAPTGWAQGCSETGADTGRWVRLVTRVPGRIGTIHNVIPDAVVASFVSSAIDPQSDPTPEVALPVGAIKGTVSPIVGVKKVTNLASRRGRGPESDSEFLRRASTRTRHRGRAITAWDYEELITTSFPEVATIRCLPHTRADGAREPGSVGLVVVPARPDQPAPVPSVSLAGQIHDAIRPRMPIHARPVVMCALYVPVSVVTDVRLRIGVAALTGKQNITSALETWLHPSGVSPARWGRPLYASSVAAFLELIPEVDAVGSVQLRDEGGRPIEMAEVDACRGLYCSSGGHSINVEEQL